MAPQEAHTTRAIEKVTLGNALLIIHDPLFLEGYTRGFREYCRSDSMTPLTDTSIGALIKKRQHNKTRSEMWNAGYVMGWITATHGIPRLRHFCKPRRHQWQQPHVSSAIPPIPER